MPRVSVFDGYMRTAEDQEEGALGYFEITKEQQDMVDNGALMYVSDGELIIQEDDVIDELPQEEFTSYSE